MIKLLMFLELIKGFEILILENKECYQNIESKFDCFKDNEIAFIDNQKSTEINFSCYE